MDAIVSQLKFDGLASRSSTVGAEKEASLFSAVRRAHGMRADDADVCYWNWMELREHLTLVWAALDKEATRRHERPIQAHVWALQEGRTLDQVVDLVRSASGSYTGGNLLTAVRRPKTSSNDKIRSVLCTTMSIVASAQSSPMRAFINEVLIGTPESSTDEEVLLYLDSKAQNAQALEADFAIGRIPRLLSGYFAAERELVAGDPLAEQLTFRRFLSHLATQSAAHLSDEELTDWIAARRLTTD
jgi:hypothetical protein